ncbi:MAG: enoyl-CoA hydratase [Pseudonocardiales bacterium]|jgi:enoyl-CoA hydratase/carnithine racemase|uniref:enoyl-CoA hydratase n=1 Tax=Pseudonocardia sp. Cha107L01 TaxID=3457576 RepID=UPI0028C536F1|nr:enoyl-CoA hydratase [Pseudonocardiales bacterium]MDT7565165.1 enoyl-CoA hydratase [Pseudonocardiales bacterium]MDT7585505.1 enoyl-CoA hydratase [Pseudonocardiales bacterium]MDT7631411.1 enoyl-CoA hydratase [Pseudonocardiales bacterium]MDT7636209.1 enoyl-CoA hydratase [Pseudonocardiales bacterium]
MTDQLDVERDGAVLRVTFNRPEAHNALTFAMYQGLYDACETADADDGIRALVLRGAGGKAFVSGTDIAQFAGFDGAAGVEYEERITRVVRRLEDTAVPTVAAIEGYCLGGGLALAAACDLRVATESARFGVPIARTLGNCLSMDTYALLVGQLGPARTLDLLLRARYLTGADAHAAGFVAELVPADSTLEEVLAGVLGTLAGHAPLTMWATKRAVARLRRANLPPGDDLVERIYGSADFARGVRLFGSRQRPDWTGT